MPHHPSTNSPFSPFSYCSCFRVCDHLAQASSFSLLPSPAHKNPPPHLPHSFQAAMKFAVAAIAIAAFATVAKADSCPPEELGKLFGIGAIPELAACEAIAEYTFLPPQGVPDELQVALMCSSSECQAVINGLVALGPLDCDTTFPNGVTLNVNKLITDLLPSCAALVSRRLRQ